MTQGHLRCADAGPLGREASAVPASTEDRCIGAFRAERERPKFREVAPTMGRRGGGLLTKRQDRVADGKTFPHADGSTGPAVSKCKRLTYAFKPAADAGLARRLRSLRRQRNRAWPERRAPFPGGMT